MGPLSRPNRSGQMVPSYNEWVDSHLPLALAVKNLVHAAKIAGLRRILIRTLITGLIAAFPHHSMLIESFKDQRQTAANLQTFRAGPVEFLLRVRRVDNPGTINVVQHPWVLARHVPCQKASGPAEMDAEPSYDGRKMDGRWVANTTCLMDNAKKLQMRDRARL